MFTFFFWIINENFIEDQKMCWTSTKPIEKPKKNLAKKVQIGAKPIVDQQPPPTVTIGNPSPHLSEKLAPMAKIGPKTCKSTPTRLKTMLDKKNQTIIPNLHKKAIKSFAMHRDTNEGDEAFGKHNET